MKSILYTALLILICFSAPGQQFRLQKIQTHNSSTGPVEAETQFYYPGNRGSDFKNGIINYDSATAFWNGKPATRYQKQFDAADRITYYSEDAVRVPPDFKSVRNTYTFDSAGRLTKSTSYNGEHHHASVSSWSEFSYNPDNTLSQINRQVFSIPDFDSIKIIYTYDSAKNVVCVIQQILDTTQQAYVNSWKDSFVYNTGNMLVEKRLEIWQSGSWQMQYKYNYTYASSGLKPAEILVSYYNTGTTPYGFIKYLCSYNSLNDTTEKIMQLYNSQGIFVNSDKAEYQYNIYNQPDKIIDSRWDTTSSSWKSPHFIRHYIYEIYWPTGISNISSNHNSEVQLYPVPASSVINIEASFEHATDINAHIYNMQGRTMMKWQENNVSEFIRTVPVREFPTGIYILKLAGLDVQITRQFSVTR